MGPGPICLAKFATSKNIKNKTNKIYLLKHRWVNGKNENRPLGVS